MRIGLITGEYPPMQGGVGDFTRELSTALLALDYEVHIITRVGCGIREGALHERKDTGRARHEPQYAADLTIHPVIANWDWRSHSRVMLIAQHHKLEVLNIQYQAAAYDMHPAINLLPWRAALFPAKQGESSCPRIVVTFHDLKVPYLFPKAGLLRDWVVTLLARHADAAIVTNRADELALTARRVDRVERIPIGSNIAPNPPDDYDRHAWRGQWKIGPADCLLGFFGFFNARKGIETLIRALALLQQKESAHSNLPHFHLLFIGGTVGSSDATNRLYAENIEALIADLGLKDRVHYTGYVPSPEVSAAFGAVDVCVLPYADGISFHHGTLMAALTHNQAIISTHPPLELPELVNGENVWLVRPEDTAELASAIATLAVDPERRARLAQGAAELSVKFSWERIAARTAELFEGLK